MGINTNRRAVKKIYGALMSADFGRVRSQFYGQATKSIRVDALAQSGDEGRGQLR